MICVDPRIETDRLLIPLKNKFDALRQVVALREKREEKNAPKIQWEATADPRRPDEALAEVRTWRSVAEYRTVGETLLKQLLVDIPRSVKDMLSRSPESRRSMAFLANIFIIP